VQVSPSNVSMRFDVAATKTVPIAPRIEGEPAPGLVVDTVSAVPATVDVVGASSVIRTMTEAITEPVSVTGAAGTVVEQVTVGVADPSVRLRAPMTARVTVTFRAR
jgi:YbbR domain-containing protein